MNRLTPGLVEIQIMGRISVHAPDEVALDLWADSLQDIATTNASWLFYAAARALRQHHENRTQYNHVMGGIK